MLKAFLQYFTLFNPAFHKEKLKRLTNHTGEKLGGAGLTGEPFAHSGSVWGQGHSGQLAVFRGALRRDLLGAALSFPLAGDVTFHCGGCGGLGGIGVSPGVGQPPASQREHLWAGARELTACRAATDKERCPRGPGPLTPPDFLECRHGSWTWPGGSGL